MLLFMIIFIQVFILSMKIETVALCGCCKFYKLQFGEF